MEIKKTEHTVHLQAILSDSTFCSSQNCDDRTDFVDTKGLFTVTEHEDGTAVIVTTGKGSYNINKHLTLNSFQGICNGIKVRVNLKKMVGTLTYWA